MPPRKATRLFVVTGCMKCPNIKHERTPGAGYALDYFCEATGAKVAGYVEWHSEEPKDGEFPDSCPLRKR